MRRPGLSAALVIVAACGSSAPEAPPAPATPDIQTREVSYQQNGTTLNGVIAWDANQTGRRPGILVVHEWWGHDEHARFQARRLAREGYVGFALDMYGEGRHAETAEEAQTLMEQVTADPAVVQARFNAAREILVQDPHVDPEQVGAIGYCFGGAVVLDMARAGADLDAVATFHGLLSTETPAQPAQVRPHILVLTGGADPFVPAEQVEAFRQEMTAAGANFEIVTYPNAMHAFTNPNAADHGMPQLAYDAEADRQSWQAMLEMFRQVFQ